MHLLWINGEVYPAETLGIRGMGLREKKAILTIVIRRRRPLS